MYPRLASDCLCSHLMSVEVYEVLGLKPRAVYMLGKLSTD